MTAVHRAVAIRGPLDDQYGPPAEICEACTDWTTGRLVPSVFCPELRASGMTAQLDENPEFLDIEFDPRDAPYLRELWRLRHEGKTEDDCSIALHGCTVDELIARRFG